MFRAHYTIWAAALGLVLFIAPESPAQHRGGGGSHVSAGRGGGHVGGAPIHRAAVAPALHGNIRAGFVGRADYGRGIYNRGWYGRGYGAGWYGGAWPWLGGGYGYYPYYSNYPYYNSGYYPTYGSYYSVPDGGSGYSSSYAGDYSTVPVFATNVAHIEVVVPDPNAKVWFNDHLTTASGLTRDFDSPLLQSGLTYSYTVKATWNQGGHLVSEESVVPIQAGAGVLINFNQNPPQVTPLH